MDSDDPRRVAAITAAAARLRVDSAATVAIAALERAGIPSLVLKGPSIARWLFAPEDARAYADCDLLIPSDRFESAVAALAAIGFEPEYEESSMPSWWREHALTLIRREHRAIVDLHRNLPGVHADDQLLWATLSASTESITLGASSVRTLSEPGRLMHLALHAAQHGGSHRDLEVLRRALAQVDEAVWRRAAELARQVDATAAFTQGLIMVPAGQELASKLGLGPPLDMDVELRATGAVEALTVARLLAAGGISARAALIRHKLFPPATFLRAWSPLARRGRLGLVLAYLYRPIWVLRRTPRALRGWSDARKRLKNRDDARNRVDADSH